MKFKALLLGLCLLLAGCSSSSSSKESIVLKSYEHSGYAYAIPESFLEKKNEDDSVEYGDDQNEIYISFTDLSGIDITDKSTQVSIIESFENDGDYEINEKKITNIANNDMKGFMAPLTTTINDTNYTGIASVLTHDNDAILMMILVEESLDDSFCPSVVNSFKPAEKGEAKEETTEKKETAKKEAKSKIDPKFKKAMDKYYKFMKKYVKFMKKYENSSDQLSMLSDYTEFMSEYADMMSKFEAIDKDELNDAELAYYIDIEAKVSKLLLQISD